MLHNLFLVSLYDRNDVNILALRQSDIFDTLDSSTKTMITLLLQNQESINQSQTCASEIIRTEHDRTRTEIISAIDRSHHHGGVQHLVMDCSVNCEQDVRASIAQRIRDSLFFRSMEDRHEEIAERHKETFEWIYHDAQAGKELYGDFAKWLCQGSGTFWIAGKAGSGKSTLMKFIYNEPRTRELLKIWAGNVPLVMTGFFFWNLGTDLQKSMIGLMRSVLYQVVRDYEALIPVLFHERWQEFQQGVITSEGWNGPELARAFHRLTRQEIIPAKFCLLIDGLDEYDGDHAVMVDLLKSIHATSSIKVCVSSRPLIVFDDAFSGGSMVMLQHLTFSDIKRYVTTKIGEHAAMLPLQGQDLELPQLITEIVERASGVFLWVKLVVRSLLDGLSNGDGVSDLQIRLRLLPTDLEKLYTHMLNSVAPTYRRQAWELFEIVRKGQGSLTILELSFAKVDLQYAINADPKLLTHREKMDRCKMMARRLKSRCKGLLEIQARRVDSVLTEVEAKDHELLDSKVVFLHKSVEDFLHKQDSYVLFEVQVHRELELFDPHICLMTSHLLKFKLLLSPGISSPDSLENWMAHFLKLVISVTKTHNAPSEAIATAMDNVDQILKCHWFSSIAFSELPLAGQIFRTDLIRDSDSNHDKTSSLALAIQFNLEDCARSKLDRHDAVNRTHSRPLLDYALFLRRRPEGRGADPPINCNVVSLLLKKGADPNESYRGSSPWKNALTYLCLYTNISEGTPVYCNQWITALKLLLENGADPNARCQHRDDHVSMTKHAWRSIHPRSSSALAIITARFPVSTQRLELEALLKQKQAGWHTKNLDRERDQRQGMEKKQSDDRETPLTSQLEQRSIESTSHKRSEHPKQRRRLCHWFYNLNFRQTRMRHRVQFNAMKEAAG